MVRIKRCIICERHFDSIEDVCHKCSLCLVSWQLMTSCSVVCWWRSVCMEFQRWAGVKANEISKNTLIKYYIVNKKMEIGLCYVLVPLTQFPVILLNRTANTMFYVSNIIFSLRRCNMDLLSYRCIRPSKCAIPREALFWMVNHSTVITFWPIFSPSLKLGICLW